jgi:hypothetical protein
MKETKRRCRAINAAGSARLTKAAERTPGVKMSTDGLHGENVKIYENAVDSQNDKNFDYRGSMFLEFLHSYHGLSY